MTDHGPGSTSPEETPTPLASTRWSEEGGADETDLMPPFIPGRGRDEASQDVAEPGGWVGPTAAESAAFVVEPEAPAGDAEGSTTPGADSAAPAWVAEDFPYEAFDLSEEEEEEEEEEEGEGEGKGEAVVEAPAETPPGDANDVAERLEEMARQLRSEGSAAAEAALGSADRLTALLAGVVAGYLVGRR